MTLNGSSKRGDKYIETRDRGGCYDCIKLCGTMLNVVTDQTVAICTEWSIQKAPHPKDGCDKSIPMPRGTPKRKRRRKS